MKPPDAAPAASSGPMPGRTRSPSAPPRVVDWGRTDYETALERQKELVEARKAGTVPDTLIFTEHEPTFTLGLRKGAGNHLVWSAARCRESGIRVIRTNRGGDITYHGPGQLVGYPIVSLRNRRDLHAYLRDLEEVILRVLHALGLPAARRRAGKTGIWLENRKICAMGVAVRSWVAYHGFALNVDPDLAHFAGIIPCGIADATVTSLARERPDIAEMETVKTLLTVEFRNVFYDTPSRYG